ncbi:MAG: hypothetical protein IPJ65_37705 [Archangiaceae bacterium]|nr:hypothetical protein [Archangiaceae bacterium]
MRLLPGSQLFLVVVSLSACGGPGYVPYQPPDASEKRGQECSTASECGTGGVCVTFTNGKFCEESCTPQQNDCGAGDTCVPFDHSSGGFCLRSSALEAADGDSCSADSQCTSGSCSTWPGGYCTKGCTTNDDCMTTSICIVRAFGTASACLERCAAPRTQSSCRAGYVCNPVTGFDDGVCMPKTSSGGAGGGLGGTGGGSGGNGGGAGGGTSTTRCRTYATSYTETITSASPTRVLMHTVSFDRATRTLTDASSNATIAQEFATLADFIDQADPAAFGRRGPVTIRTTSANSTAVTRTYYDSQGRAQTLVTQMTAGTTSFEAMRATFSQWDSFGRPLAGRADLSLPIETERCVGQQVTQRFNDATHTFVTEYTGGTTQSALGIVVCRPHGDTEVFDARFIRLHATQVAGGETVQSDTTVTGTATVCL